MNGFNQNVDLDIGGMLSKSWEIFQRDMVNWILIGIVGSLALGVGGWGGFQYCALKAARGESVSVGDVFYPFQHFGRLFIPMLAILGIVIFTCGLGGLVVGFLWFWMYSLMVDRGLSFGDAAKLSKDAAMANVGPTILTMVVMFALNMVGNAVVIGTLITMPIGAIFAILAYLNIFGNAPSGGSPQSLDYSPNAPAPMGAPAGGYAPPAAAPAPVPGATFQPPAGAPGPAVPAPAPAPVMPAPAAPAPAAPTPAPAAPAPVAPAPASNLPPAADTPVETAQQSTTNNPDEIVAGRTIAMNTMDFEKMLKEQGGGDNK